MGDPGGLARNPYGHCKVTPVAVLYSAVGCEKCRWNAAGYAAADLTARAQVLGRAVTTTQWRRTRQKRT